MKDVGIFLLMLAAIFFSFWAAAYQVLEVLL
jgi:hypothetical protein